MISKEDIRKALAGYGADSYTVGRYTVKIEQDTHPESPREWDNAGKMVCWHSRYNLGDEQPNGQPIDYYNNVIAPIVKDGGACLPLYLYDHGGITISTGAFTCPWDSGQVGWIYIDKDTMRKEWGTPKRISKQARDKARKYLEGEVETYDQYLTGRVYGFIIERDGEHVDSCWGFYGDEYVRDEVAANVAHFMIDDLAKAKQRRIDANKERKERHHWACRGVVTK